MIFTIDMLCLYCNVYLYDCCWKKERGEIITYPIIEPTTCVVFCVCERTTGKPTEVVRRQWRSNEVWRDEDHGCLFMVLESTQVFKTRSRKQRGSKKESADAWGVIVTVIGPYYIIFFNNVFEEFLYSKDSKVIYRHRRIAAGSPRFDIKLYIPLTLSVYKCDFVLCVIFMYMLLSL